MALDERLRGELDRAAEPADPSGVYEGLIRKKERRRLAKRMQSGLLAMVVVGGTALGFVSLFRVFGTGVDRAGAGPINGLIAFTNFEPGGGIPDVTVGWAIYTMEPDGSDVRLVGPPEVDEALYPSFSPDGRQIAFAGFVADPEERGLYVMDATGASVRRILVLEDRHQIDGLAWSPDGSRIGIVHTELIPIGTAPEAGARDVDEFSTIWTIGSDGSDLRQVTNVGREDGFSWNPDGTQIVFSRHEPITEGDRYVANDIYVIDVDGTNERQLTEDGISMSPAWSPDGSQIAFESYDPGIGPEIDLYVMSADGNGRRRLTSDPGNEYGPTWSPDGRLIAYGALSPVANETSQCSISTIRPDGSNRTRLYGTAGVADCPGPWSIAWAPAVQSSLDTPAPTPTPSAEATVDPTPTETPSAEAGQDIGLGFRVCDVTFVRGEFEPGVVGTAYVGTGMDDTGGCPDLDDGAFQVLAADVTGDDIADVSFGPLECDPFCSAFAAPDIDGDGADELLVQNVQFSIAGVKLYEVIGDREIVPITIGSVGTGGGDFQGGTEPQFWIGGDAGEADAIRCDPYEDRRAFISTTSFQAIDTNDDIAVTETVFVLKGTFLSVVEVREFNWPSDDDSRPFLGTGGCGADLDPSA